MTEADFDTLSWHDCHIWGLEIRSGDPREGDWTSELVLHLDFILEWICDTGGHASFRVAPAELTFHGATDLRIELSPSYPGYQVSLSPPAIESIEREPVRDQRVFLDRPYYRWRIELSSPPRGFIEFGAVGFAQRLLAVPVVSQEQQLTLRRRVRLLGR